MPPPPSPILPFAPSPPLRAEYATPRHVDFLSVPDDDNPASLSSGYDNETPTRRGDTYIPDQEWHDYLARKSAERNEGFLFRWFYFRDELYEVMSANPPTPAAAATPQPSRQAPQPTTTPTTPSTTPSAQLPPDTPRARPQAPPPPLPPRPTTTPTTPTTPPAQLPPGTPRARPQAASSRRRLPASRLAATSFANRSVTRPQTERQETDEDWGEGPSGSNT